MKNRARLFGGLARGIATLALIVCLGALIFAGMQISGKNSLYGGEHGAGPDLNQAAFAEAAAASGENASGTSGGESLPEDWQEGDVRYQGVHYRYNEDMLTFLFLGIDKQEEALPVENGISGGQSDAIFLLTLNPHNKEVVIIGIPRDTMTEIEVYGKSGDYIGNAVAQLTLQHGYGDGAEISSERSVSAVSKLFYGLPVHGYCSINMGAIPLINDAVGGVELTALEDVPYTQMEEGQLLHLKGQDAYYYLQNRDINSMGSAQRRLERQKQYLAAYAQAAIDAMKEDIAFPVKLYNAISEYMVTDITVDEVSYLAARAPGYHFESENFRVLEGELKMGETFEEFYADEKALYELILEVFYEEVDS